MSGVPVVHRNPAAVAGLRELDHWRPRGTAAVVDSMHSLKYIRDVMAAQLTIRGVSEDLHRRLAALATARGQSLNATVLALLQGAVGRDERRERLARYASWTAEDLAEFEAALSAQRTVDDDLWK